MKGRKKKSVIGEPTNKNESARGKTRKLAHHEGTTGNWGRLEGHEVKV